MGLHTNLTRRVGFAVYEGSMVSINDEHTQLGEHYKINFPFGKLTVDHENVVLAGPLRSYTIPVAEIESVQNLFWFAARIKHGCPQVPQQVIVHAAWPIFSALRLAVSNSRRLELV